MNSISKNIDKKGKTRFTIRFNPADPKHQRTIEVLSTAGRRKASLISEAVCEYLAQHDRHSFENAMSLISKISPQATAVDSTKQDIQDNNESANTESKAEPKAEPKTQLKETGDSDISDVQNTQNIQNNIPFDHDMQQAVLGGLSMFGNS